MEMKQKIGKRYQSNDNYVKAKDGKIKKVQCKDGKLVFMNY